MRPDRQQQVETTLDEIYQNLAEYEEKLSIETDPLSRRKIEDSIELCKNNIAYFEKELESLKAKPKPILAEFAPDVPVVIVPQIEAPEPMLELTEPDPAPVLPKPASKSTKSLSLDALLDRVYKAEDREEWKKVIDLGNEVLELDPNNRAARSKLANAHYQRACLHNNDENYNQAVTEANHAIEFVADNSDFYIVRGVAYNFLEEYEKGVKDFTHALKLNPENIQAYYERGVSYGWLKENEKEIDDLNRLLEADPEHIDGYMERGLTYSVLEDYEKALKDLNQAVKLDPENAIAYFNRGAVNRDSGNKTAAKRDFRKAHELGYEDAAQALEELE